MRTIISRLEDELLDSRIDLSACAISRQDADTLVVTSRIGAFRMFVSLLFGLPSLYLLYAVFVRPPVDHFLFTVFAVASAPVLACFSLLFGFAVSKKAFNRLSHEARWSLELFTIKRERSTQLAKDGVVTVWSEWGDDDRPSLWFNVDIEEHKELGLCIGWRYEEALGVALRLADFLSYKLVNLVSDEHRVRAVRARKQNRPYAFFRTRRNPLSVFHS